MMAAQNPMRPGTPYCTARRRMLRTQSVGGATRKWQARGSLWPGQAKACPTYGKSRRQPGVAAARSYADSSGGGPLGGHFAGRRPILPVASHLQLQLVAGEDAFVLAHHGLAIEIHFHGEGDVVSVYRPVGDCKRPGDSGCLTVLGGRGASSSSVLRRVVGFARPVTRSTP